jgi:NAD-dependent deacetylase
MFSPEEQNFPLKKVKDAAKEIGTTNVVVLTGAGISVASGIMPFRGKGGLWEKYDPEEVANIENFRRNPKKSWVMLKEVLEVVEKALPNPAHLSLARMEEMGFASSIITQNIDGLHQKAGSKTVIEFHGNTTRLVCLGCAALYPAREIDLSSLPPYCPVCNGVLKPDAVFFGESIPRNALYQAHMEVQQCQVMLVVGTSGMVEPAASLPRLAKSKGAFIIEINPEHSYLTSSITTLFLQGKAEEVLPVIFEELCALRDY